jgi:deoxyadenosine/deoxycytidine kinase
MAMYIVEGNIGTGKSTFLRLIEQHISFLKVVYEPLHTWQSEGNGESILRNFYHDPQRWAFTMETVAMASRVHDHIKEQHHPSPYRVLERSIYSGHYCFAKNDYNNGFMNDLEWHMYNDWFTLLVSDKCKPPLGFIYLQTTPEISFERIKKRARSTESTIPLLYLKQIDDCHTSFLINKENILPELQNVPVLVLNCDEEFETNTLRLQEHLKQVILFIEKTAARSDIPGEYAHEKAVTSI